MLQSVFILRSYNDDVLRKNSSLPLVAASLAASLLSVSNKYFWFDGECFSGGEEPQFKKSYPCINPLYVARVIWRFSFIVTRFSVLSLVWSVLGGAFVGIFLGISFLSWCIALIISAWEQFTEKCNVVSNGIIFGLISLISTPATGKWIFICVHIMEMVITMTIITIFAFNKNIECGVCAEINERQASDNPYIFMFIFTGWIAMVIDFILYLYLKHKDIFDMDELYAFEKIGMGIDKQKLSKKKEKIELQKQKEEKERNFERDREEYLRTVF